MTVLRLRCLVAVVVASVLCAIATSPAAGQRAGVGAPPPGVDLAVRVLPDTVTVGDSVRAVVRIRLPAGSTAEWDDFAPFDTSAVQLLAPPQILPPSPGAGRADPLAVVHLVAWRTGRLPSLTGRVRIVPRGGETAVVPVVLAMPHVRSVLPGDTTGVRPRGAKDVLGASYDWRRLAAAAVAALLVLLLVASLVRRLVRRLRRGRRLEPRREALRELDALRAAGAVDAAEFYARLAATLRTFVARRWPRWGMELTTTELLERMAADGVPAERAGPLEEALTAADLAKFARVHPAADERERHLAATRAWVSSADFAAAEPAPADTTATEVAR